jgi:hypothetical protein
MMAEAVITLPSASQTAVLVAAAVGTSMLSAVAGFGGGMLLSAACIATLGPATGASALSGPTHGNMERR